MSSEVVALVVIAVFQAVQTMLMAMGTFIIKDMRDRISRLESLEMGKGFKTHG
jgi:5-carboxymethyl-2-hydroxymuconate isomerase